MQLSLLTAGLTLPPICANCGVSTPERLPVDKVFERHHTDSPTSYVIERISAPFCRTCIERHRLEAKVITPLQRLLLCFRSSALFGAIAAAATGLWLTPKLLPSILTGDRVEVLVFSAILGFFALVAYGCFRAAWSESERFAVIPQTSITSAFDYSDSVSELFEKPRRVYTLRNEQFAKAFVDANRSRVWDPSSAPAQAASHKRAVLLYAVIGALVCVVAWELVSELVR